MSRNSLRQAMSFALALSVPLIALGAAAPRASAQQSQAPPAAPPQPAAAPTPSPSTAIDNNIPRLPPIVVIQPQPPAAAPESNAKKTKAVAEPDDALPAKPAKKRVVTKKKKNPVSVVEAQPAPDANASDQPALGNGNASALASGNPADRSGALTVANTAEARAEIERTAGGVEIVPDTAFKNTPANTVKDVLGSVPGVTIQTRWGPDARLSIRGSGLTRSYGNRGLNMYMDGLAINTSDGLFDVFEIDPAAYRYVEVFKGANALRYGSNSLGGAVNFVTPTGYDASPFEMRVDAGSFGYVRSQMSSGRVSGPWDYFVSLSGQREDGFRDHSAQDIERLNANLGYRLSPDAETRFYVNANRWRGELPGEVTRASALNTPRAAAFDFLLQNQQRNIDSIRVANKTTLRLDGTVVELGIYAHQRHVDHPIFQYLDYTVADYGGFVRATSERMIGGYRNRTTTGINLLNGALDYQQYINNPGAVRGALTFDSLDSSKNLSAYAEHAFYLTPALSLIAGIQFQHTVRDREDRFLSDGDQSGRRTFDIWSPKLGILWDVDPAWQIFANVSRSAEVPTFDVNTFSTPATSVVEAQTATTLEIGTRGRRPDFVWDISLYRAEIDNELQCLTAGLFAACTTVNADKTVHQGIEAGLGVAIAKSTFDLNDRFWLNLVYNYNDFFFDGDATWGNNRLPGVAPHNLKAEVLYKHPNGFYAGPNVEWVPEGFYSDNTNILKSNPYALLNLRIGYDQEVGWSGYIEGRNLLDKRYISSTITIGDGNPIPIAPPFFTPLPLFGELYNPGTGISVYGGLRYRM
ncbi:MAG: TonB-dependent receptor family protein [Hyphomicrobiaceae bacterium]